MRSFKINPTSSLKKKTLSLKGDKSIAHRLLILGAISIGKMTLKNFPFNEDCLWTLKALKRLGVKIKLNSSSLSVTIWGKGLYGLKEPKVPLYVGNSGTTFRLLAGLLAGQDFKVKLRAGESLSQRPMLRITQPLRMMGADIQARKKIISKKIEEYPPLIIRGRRLSPITYKLPVASAQVKSAILLAGLYAQGETKVIEPIRTRDHTERLLKLFKAKIKVKQNQILIKGGYPLYAPSEFYIPSDISSASFFIVLTCCLRGASLLIKNVSINPTRIGIIRVLKRMQANIEIRNLEEKKTFEPMADIKIRYSPLKATKVRREEVPSLIDELPILMVACSLAEGKSILEGVEELRVKETDRIESMVGNLSLMGAKIRVLRHSKNREDIEIEGVSQLKGAKLRSFSDHRTAMSLTVAGLLAKGDSQIDDFSCIRKSFPEFMEIVKDLVGSL
ncbi:MAG: 3-phosphoshikimate 1-carboxyvinyltransferase [Candidatus Omnitrophica bacterium]|nr:3-phosphoshikimate 1-carboxyvinyltransferase [Candidatus Omnitrophota bacterium]